MPEVASLYNAHMDDRHELPTLGCAVSKTGGASGDAIVALSGAKRKKYPILARFRVTSGKAYGDPAIKPTVTAAHDGDDTDGNQLIR